MNPIIKILPTRKLIGKHLTMNIAGDRTSELWKSFMPVRKEIRNSVSTVLFSMQNYDKSFRIEDLDTNTVFEKWAAMEVADFNSIPDGMEAFILPEGLYAVFHYKGLSTDDTIFRYIFGTWLPASDYILDNRPHFEILGEKYKNNDPESEEEICIPVRLRNAED
jgi:AraC family transcriptional regulator